MEKNGKNPTDTGRSHGVDHAPARDRQERVAFRLFATRSFPVRLRLSRVHTMKRGPWDCTTPSILLVRVRDRLATGESRMSTPRDSSRDSSLDSDVGQFKRTRALCGISTVDIFLVKDHPSHDGSVFFRRDKGRIVPHVWTMREREREFERTREGLRRRFTPPSIVSSRPLVSPTARPVCEGAGHRAGRSSARLCPAAESWKKKINIFEK